MIAMKANPSVCGRIYGLTVHQTYRYYRMYDGDIMLLKALVCESYRAEGTDADKSPGVVALVRHRGSCVDHGSDFAIALSIPFIVSFVFMHGNALVSGRFAAHH